MRNATGILKLAAVLGVRNVFGGPRNHYTDTAQASLKLKRAFASGAISKMFLKSSTWTRNSRPTVRRGAARHGTTRHVSTARNTRHRRLDAKRHDTTSHGTAHIHFFGAGFGATSAQHPLHGPHPTRTTLFNPLRPGSTHPETPTQHPTHT